MAPTTALTELEVAVYRAIVHRPGVAAAGISEQLRDPLAPLDKVLATLAEIGLVRENGGLYTAVNPWLAEAITLGGDELELAARRASVEARRALIRQVLPEWKAYARDDSGAQTVEIVLDPDDIVNVTMYYAEQCENELLSVALRAPQRADPRQRTANIFNAARGIKTRALYPHSALRDRATRAHLRELSEVGTKIRLATSLPGRSLVVDRRVAMLPIPRRDDPTHFGLAVVHEPNVVSWVVATFEQMWVEASPLQEMLGNEYASAEIDQTRAAILRMLAEGEKDEAISRRLSISVRTCRRHIAEYMAQIGATSRFQAGVIAARARHLDRSDSSG